MKLTSCNRQILFVVGVMAIAFGQLSTAFALPILIDDDFDNGDIGTGGINGGFSLRSNGGGGAGSVSESGGNAAVLTTGSNDNSGIVSLNSIDIAGRTDGFTMRFVVSSISKNPQNNGMFLGIQEDGTSFYRDVTNFGLVFSGNEGRTASAGGFALVTNDIGGGGSSGNGTIFDDVDIQLASLQDGFEATIMATPEGWMYEVTGINDLSGFATTISNSNTWVGSGEAATFYTDFFDNAEFLAAWAQRAGAPNITTLIDRITAEGKINAVPEPTTATLGLIGVAGLMVRRRRAA